MSFKTFDNSGPSPWSNLDEDPLFTIMMLLGLVDFFAFRKVCKSWRSLAFSHMKKYMSFQQPLSVSFFTVNKAECNLEDYEKLRLFKTVVPPSTAVGTVCVGLTCGYLIFFNRTVRDFWLVNPFTSHELHFPTVPPFDEIISPAWFRGILVFSPSVYRWVFLFSVSFSYKISFTCSGNQGSWSHLTSEFFICDMLFFKGRIYMINKGNYLYEVRLDPTPTLTLLGMKNIPDVYFLIPELVSSGENLYMVKCFSKCKIYEIDFERMEWLLTEKSEVEYAFFVGGRKSSAAVNPDTWAELRMRYDDISKLKGRGLIGNMWYFPHDCLNVNTLQLE